MGCRPCPSCGHSAVDGSGHVYHWTCGDGHETNGDIRRPPTKCAGCPKTDLQIHARMLLLCKCLKCDKEYDATLIDWEEPPGFAELLEQIAMASVPPGARR